MNSRNSLVCSNKAIFQRELHEVDRLHLSHQSLVKLYPISLQVQKDMLHCWKSPAVISSPRRGLQTRRQGPIVVLYFVPRTRPWQGSGLESFGLGETIGTLLESLFPEQIQSGKEKKGKLHSYLVLEGKMVCLKPSKLYLIG